MPRNSLRPLLLSFLTLVGLLFIQSEAWAEKYCSASGTYYCASGARDPASSSYCDIDPYNALIEGINYSSNFCTLEHGTLQEWQYFYLISESSDGIYKEHAYKRDCYYGEDWYPPYHSQPAEVKEYQCSSCTAPFEWDSESKSCVTRCPPDSEGFDYTLGMCTFKPKNEPNQCDKQAGNPINILSGEKVERFKPDIRLGTGAFPIEFARTYRSLADPYLRQQKRLERTPDHGDWSVHYQPDGWQQPTLLHPQGPGSTFARMNHNYDKRIIKLDDRFVYYRAPVGQDEKVRIYTENNPFSGGVIRALPSGWEVITHKGIREVYSAEGLLTELYHPSGASQQLTYNAEQRLIRIEDDKGYALTLAYNAEGQLSELHPPNGQAVYYHYNPQGRMESVTYPDETTERYFYEDPIHSNLLTALEDGAGVRFAEWTYDSQGRATTSQHAGGADYTAVHYLDGQSQVTNSKGHVKSVHFTDDGRIDRIQGRSCSTAYLKGEGGEPGEVNYDYIGTGRAITTDENGSQTYTDYYANGQINSIERGYGTAEAQRTYYSWHPVYQKPTRIYYPNGRDVNYTYGDHGRLEQVEEKADWISRITTRHYNDQGLLASVDGLRTDVDDITTYRYDDQRRLRQVVNALGQATEIQTYDAYGNIAQVQDPNGAVTQFTYDERGRITEQRLSASGQHDQVHAFSYDGRGLLTGITLSTGAVLTYQYDDARRLKAIEDGLGNRIELDVDSEGEITERRILDAQGMLRKTQSFVYDPLNRLHQTLNANQDTWESRYDSAGNRIQQVDPKGNSHHYDHDALQRLSQHVDPLAAQTDIQYNAQNQIEAVTDPRGLTTQYQYNGFGELTQLTSPDTGATTYDYDGAGNRIRQTDANGRVTEYDYDALNRRTAIRYPATPEHNVSFEYDDTSLDASGKANAGVGRLTAVDFPGGEYRFRYDKLGRLVKETHTVGTRDYTLAYRYNAQGQLSARQLPSGAWLGYAYSEEGQLTGLYLQDSADASSGPRQPIVDELTYRPFGPLTHLRYGNGIEQTNHYDRNYRLTEQVSSVWDRGYYYDPNANIDQIEDYLNDHESSRFEYDPVDRLVDAEKPTARYLYDYDPVGNRERKTENSATTDYGYATQSNRLLNEADWLYEYDAAGNLLGNGRFDFTYNEQGHLARVHDAQSGELVADYGYNPNRQRIKKTVPYSGPDYAALAEEHQALAEQHQQEAQALADQANGLTAQATQSQDEADQRATEAQTQQTLADQHQAEADALTEQANTVQAHADDYYQAAADQAARIVEPAKGFTQWFTNLIARMLSGWYTFVADYYQGQADALAETAATQQADAEKAQVQADTLAQAASDAQARADQGNAEAQTLSDQAKNHHEKADAALAQVAEYQAQAAAPSSGTQTTHFVYHPDGTLAGEYNEDGTPRREYVYLAGRPIAVIEPSSTAIEPSLYFTHSDHLGTPKVLTDQDQAVVWKATHTPFGQATVTTNTVTNHLRFPGQYYDEETGLHQNWHRYYDPKTGRYITSDIIGLAGGLNTYGYAYQNPVNYIDPDGQIAFLAIPFLGGFGGATAGGGTAAGLGTALLGGGAIAAILTIPSDSAVDNIQPNTSDNGDGCCEQLYAQITSNVNILKKRYWEMAADQMDLYNSRPTGTMSWEGHQQQYRGRQARLRKLLNEADAKGCTGYQTDAWSWATKPPPSQPAQ